MSNTGVTSLQELSLPVLEYLNVSFTGICQYSLPTNLYNIVEVKLCKCRTNALELSLALLQNKWPLLRVQCAHQKFSNTVFVDQKSMSIGDSQGKQWEHVITFSVAEKCLYVSVQNVQTNEFVDFDESL